MQCFYGASVGDEVINVNDETIIVNVCLQAILFKNGFYFFQMVLCCFSVMKIYKIKDFFYKCSVCIYCFNMVHANITFMSQVTNNASTLVK